MIIALIPAHNEAEQIGNTIISLREQAVPPDRIIVIADNCTDDTRGVAYAHDAEVWPTLNNTGKKAGALNQVVDHLLDWIEDDDLILAVDADSILCPEWTWEARRLVRHPGTGAVSGAYVARKGRGMVTLLQRAEYAQERRRIARKGGHVDVLSGTAVMFAAATLRELVAVRGYVYDEASLTEDFEITLALQHMGYRPRCYKQLRVVTDVMETWGALARQRLRWQRGTIETLRDYGWTPITGRLWRAQGLTYGSTFITLAIVAAWVLAATSGGSWDPRWLAILPVFMVEQIVTTWRAGWAPVLLAAVLVPMWCYDVFRVAVYWRALTLTLRRTEAAWT